MDEFSPHVALYQRFNAAQHLYRVGTFSYHIRQVNDLLTSRSEDAKIHLDIRIQQFVNQVSKVVCYRTNQYFIATLTYSAFLVMLFLVCKQKSVCIVFQSMYTPSTALLI